MTGQDRHIAVWNNCLQIIASNIDPQKFNTWFKPIRPVSLVDSTLTVEVPTDFFRDYIEGAYLDLLKMTLKRAVGTGAQLHYMVRPVQVEKPMVYPASHGLAPTNRTVAINTAKYIFRILVGTLVAIQLILLLLTSLPAVQTWGADIASRYLAEKTGARVSIGRLRLKMTGHVTLDNVKLYDLSDTLMLRASRIAAKIDLMQLPRKKIRIPAAQIIGAQAKLYKDGEAPFNFQFLVDAFSSQDTTSTPLDLGISALVVRRGEVSFDRIGRPVTPGRLNPDHLHIKELNLTARILAHMPDTLAVNLRNLSLSEQSGLRLQKLSFEARAGQHNASIRDFFLEMPESSASAEFVLDKARLLSAAEPIRLDSLRGEGMFSAHISVAYRRWPCLSS